MKTRIRTVALSPIWLLACLLLASCDSYGPSSSPDRPGGSSSWGFGRKAVLEDAERALIDGDMPRAEKSAMEFTNRVDVDRAQLGRGWRVLALAALENRNAFLSLNALERWRQSLNLRQLPEEWLETWNGAMLLLPPAEAARRAEAISAQKTGQPEDLTREARLFLLEDRLRGGGRETLPQFEAIYRESDAQDKRALEMRLFRLLHGVNPSQLPFLLGATNEYNESRYPYALIRLENARRLFWESKTQDQARENLAYLRDGSQLLDQSLFSVWNQPDWTTLKKVRVHNKALVLVLPLSGQYGNLSEKIVQGTEAALSGLRRHGRAMRLFVIDSDEPGWTEKLKALPPEARLVGGPLRREDYLALRSLGILEERLYFAFLPQLDEADEGVTAWRFFPSRQDQTRVMLDFASGLGLTDYAVFAPDAGEYSRQMFDLFYSLAAEKELKVARAGYYPSAQYQLWVKSVSDFLGITQDTPDNFPLDFQAMFLPDNWSNSFNMISHVFYCIENNILFMGTNLWEHGLTAQDHLPLRNFRLAVFPGGWNPQNPAISAGNLRSVSALRRTTADFWLSLGHDFALMAAALKLPEQPDPEEVNAALASLPDLPWSGAPTQWDDHGLARQELFVLAPAENGFTSVNLERIKARLNQTQSSAIVHRERSRPGRRLNAEPVEPD